MTPPEVKSSGVTWDDTLDEGTFTSELLKGPLRTSSPLEITAARKSVLKSARLDEDQQDRYVQHVKGQEVEGHRVGSKVTVWADL